MKKRKKKQKPPYKLKGERKIEKIEILPAEYGLTCVKELTKMMKKEINKTRNN